LLEDENSFDEAAIVGIYGEKYVAAEGSMPVAPV
jgi:hypothetical protein